LRNPSGATYKAIELWRRRKEADLPLNTLESVITQFGQIILSGPPGTGKTRRALQLAARLCGISRSDLAVDPKSSEHAEFLSCRLDSLTPPSAKGRWAIVQFHPSYNYEDFVRGIRVRTEQGNPVYETKDGIFARIAERARRDPDHNYILVVDEINRANLAAVLGELIYALEYRDEPVSLAYELIDSSQHGEGDSYSKQRELVVPRKNLFIVGTMNTADRSIGHIDYAVRRRFAFVPMLPAPDAILSQGDDISSAASSLYDAVAALFVENGIRSRNLSAEFHPDDVQPGHTYFLAQRKEELIDKFTYHVYPLLREYYKDGILSGEGISLQAPFSAVALNPLMHPWSIEEAIWQALGGRRPPGRQS
jgi:AAA domain (dynein-related subfamily)